MSKYGLMLATLLVASSALTAPRVYERNIDLQSKPMDMGGKPSWDIGVKVGNVGTVRLNTFYGTNVFDASSYTATFHIGPSREESGQIEIACTTTSTYVEFTFSTNNLAYPFGDKDDKWYSALRFVSGSDPFSQPEGTITCSGAPEVDGGSIEFTNTRDWALYTFLHGASGPAIGDASTITWTTNSNGQIVFSAVGLGLSITNVIEGPYIAVSVDGRDLTAGVTGLVDQVVNDAAWTNQATTNELQRVAIATNAADIALLEAFDAAQGNTNTAFRSALDDLEAATNTFEVWRATVDLLTNGFGDIVTHDASEFTTDAELAEVAAYTNGVFLPLAGGTMTGDIIVGRTGYSGVQYRTNNSDTAYLEIYNNAGMLEVTGQDALGAPIGDYSLWYSAGDAWKVFYLNGSGVLTEVAIGAAGTVLQSGGTNSAPTFAAESQTLQDVVDLGGTATNMGAVTMVGNLAMSGNNITGAADIRVTTAFYVDTDSYSYWGADSDVSIGFNGSDMLIDSADITANDEILFTDFDAYRFDDHVAITSTSTNSAAVQITAPASMVANSKVFDIDRGGSIFSVDEDGDVLAGGTYKTGGSTVGNGFFYCSVSTLESKFGAGQANNYIRATVSGEVYGDTTTGDDDWRVTVDADSYYFEQYVGDSVWTERMRIDGSGNVGIGTNALLAKLHVNSTSTNSAALQITGHSGTSVAIPLDVQASNDAGASDYLLRIGDSADNQLMWLRGTGTLNVDGAINSGSGGSINAGTGLNAANGGVTSTSIAPFFRWTDATAGDATFTATANADALTLNDDEQGDVAKWTKGVYGLLGMDSNSVSVISGYAGIVAFTNSGTAQLFAWNDAGTFTQLSAHDTATGKGYDHSFNIYTGERKIFRREEWYAAIDATDGWVSRKQFETVSTGPTVHPEKPTPQERWNAHQQDKVQEAHTRRTEWTESVAAYASYTNTTLPTYKAADKAHKAREKAWKAWKRYADAYPGLQAAWLAWDGTDGSDEPEQPQPIPPEPERAGLAPVEPDQVGEPGEQPPIYKAKAMPKWLKDHKRKATP